MRIADRQFSPPLWAVLLYLVVLSCMLLLGNWQLNRAALKISLQHAAEQARNTAPIELSDVVNLDEAAARYTRVVLEGDYDTARQFLWDNRTYKGRAGFEVIVPMQLLSGQWVLVNRGWTAPGENRQQLPDVSFSPVAAEGMITIEGFLSQPSKGFASGDAVSIDSGWPKLLQYFDYQALAQQLGEPIVPAVVQAQALAIDGDGVTVLSPRPEWLTANWQPAASGPAKHYSYAFQWFAMAIALTILFLVVNTRKTGVSPASRVNTDD